MGEGVASPGHGLEAAVQYVVGGGLYLTALEMYHELLDRNIVERRLKDFVEQRTGHALFDPETDSCGGDDEPGPADSAASIAVREMQQLASENAQLLKQLEEARRQQTAKRDAGLGHEIHLLSEQLKQQEMRERDVLGVLAERLPNVITSVRSSRKDSLIHILLTAIEHHPEPRVRASLLFHYVTLFKRPDDDQRHQLTEGLRQLAERLVKTDPTRVETELLAAVRGLMEYRYPEQRVFAVHAIQALCPCLHPTVQRELVVNMCKVLLADSSSSVREAAILAVAELKLPSNTGQLLVTALGDSSAKVQKASLQQALPSIAKMAVADDAFVSSLLSPLIDSLRLDVSQARVAAVDYCISWLRDHILESVPPVLGSKTDDLSALMSRAISRKVKGLWPVGEWVLGPFILMMLHIIATTTSPQQDCAVMVLSSSVLTLTPVLDEVVTPLFSELVLSGLQVLDREHLSPEQEDELRPNWALFRPFVRYSLTLDSSTRSTSSISDLLIAGVKRCKHDEDELVDFARMLCDVADEYDEVQVRAVDVLWDCVVQDDVHLRRAAASCFSVLLHGRCLNAQLVTKRVLPALISISTDESDEVRVAAVACTAFLATQLAAPDVLQKLGSSLVSSFRFDIKSCQPWLQSLVNHVGKMPPAFVAEHVYPLLNTAIAAATEAAPQNPRETTSIVLLLCECVKVIVHMPHHEIPEAFSASCLVTSLRGLAKVLTDQKASVLQMAKELEHVESDRENKKERFLSKFRDLLPNVDTERVASDAKQRGSLQGAPRISPKDRDRQVGADDMATPAYVASAVAHATHPATQTMQAAQTAHQGAPRNRSLLTKVQQKLFGVHEAGQ